MYLGSALPHLALPLLLQPESDAVVHVLKPQSTLYTGVLYPPRPLTPGKQYDATDLIAALPQTPTHSSPPGHSVSVIIIL